MNKMILNMLWLVLEKMIVLLGGLVVTVVVARHLGPVEFGKLTFGVTIAGFLVVVSQWGASQSIYILSSTKRIRSVATIIASEHIRAAIYIVIWLIASVILYFIDGFSNDIGVISLVMLSFLFSGLDIYQYHLNATTKSKVNASVTLKATMSSLASRLFLVAISSSTLAFVIPYFIQSIISYYGKRNVVKKEIHKNYVYHKFRYMRRFFSTGVKFCMLNSITFIYMKIGSVMIATNLGVEDFSYFNTAYVLAHVWTFLPLAIGTTLLSKGLAIKDENVKESVLSLILFIMLVVSLPFMTLYYFYSDLIVDLTFGEEYEKSAMFVFELSVVAYLSTLVWILNRIVGAFKGDGFLLKKTIFLTIISLPLNVFMLYEYGALGAVYSMLIVEFLSGVVLNMLYRKGMLIRMIFSLKLKNISYLR